MEETGDDRSTSCTTTKLRSVIRGDYIAERLRIVSWLMSAGAHCKVDAPQTVPRTERTERLKRLRRSFGTGRMASPLNDVHALSTDQQSIPSRESVSVVNAFMISKVVSPTFAQNETIMTK